MALSRKDILNGLKEGSIVISEYEERQLNNCSYDVTLGSYYFRPRNTSPDLMVCPDTGSTMRTYWSDEPCEAALIGENTMGLPPSYRVIVLKPGEIILGHTNEFIGGRGNITTMLRNKSTTSRSFVTVCNDGGWGDIGYINRWALCIKNHSTATVVLPVGRPIAQIVFLESGDPDSATGLNTYNSTMAPDGKVTFSYEKIGNYQKSADLATVMATWTPASILPRTREVELPEPVRKP